MRASRTDEAAVAVSSPVAASNAVKDGTAVPVLDVQLRKRFAASAQEFLLEAEFRGGPGFTILFGQSGAGKTTMLDCVAGLAKPDSGASPSAIGSCSTPRKASTFRWLNAMSDTFFRASPCFRISRWKRTSGTASGICRSPNERHVLPQSCKCFALRILGNVTHARLLAEKASAPH